MDAYKYILSSFAYSDAKHDFNVNQFYLQHTNTIQDGIPSSQHRVYSENGLMRSIRVAYDNTTTHRASNFTLINILDDLDDIVDVYLSMGDKLSRHYMISTVHYQEGPQVITDLNYFPIVFGGKRTFIIDFYNMKFFDGFKNNEDRSLYDPSDPYYVLYNRETQNDPARKAILDNDHRAHIGYCLKDVHDIDSRDVLYSRWQSSHIYYKNMFYSNYDYILRGTGNNVKLLIDTGTRIIEQVDPKANNSIQQLMNRVNSNEFNLTPSLAFQIKRSGDCLQALSMFDNGRLLTDNRAHNLPKMLITHDRMLLYYSLLLGIDVGFTYIRQNNGTQHYLIVFSNLDSKYAHTSNNFNYSTNQYIGFGGKTKVNRKYKYTIKNRRNIKKNVYKKRKMEELYHLLTIPEIDQYRTDKYKFKEYKLGIEALYRFISIPSNKHKLIRYITFMNTNGPFDIVYISSLVNLKYINQCAIMEYDKEYERELAFINSSYVTSAYSIPSFDTKLKEVVTYYQLHDTRFATYVKSVHCLLWIIRYYQHMYYDSQFNACDKQKLKEVLTNDMRNQLYDEAPTNHNYPNTDDGTLDLISDVLLDNSDKYKELYEEVYYTSDWNFTDLSRIIYYVDAHDLDLSVVLQRLSDDYSWAMSLPVKKPGIQSTSIMILGDLDYYNKHKLERTPDVQAMIDAIYDTPSDLYKKDFNRSLDALLRLYKRTVEKHLVWGSRLF